MSLVGSREPPCRRPSDGAVGAELPCEAIGRLRRPNSPCNDHLALLRTTRSDVLMHVLRCEGALAWVCAAPGVGDRYNV